jgi:hypothetical protein
MANVDLKRVVQKQARAHAPADAGNEVKKITRAKNEPPRLLRRLLRLRMEPT